MSVWAVCPLCHVSFAVADAYEGKRVLCTSCRKPFDVPATVVPAEEGVVEAEVDEEVITAVLARPTTARGDWPRPVAGKAGKAKPERQPGRHAAPCALVLLIGGGAGALAVLAGGIVLAAYL